MGKLITVTANTAIDLVLDVDGLTKKDNLMAHDSREYACGKGVNVARAIASLREPVTCLGFVGKQSEPLFKTLDSAWLHTDLTAVEGKTRTNITLFDSSNRRETHIRTTGFGVSADDCHRLASKLGAQLTAGDVVVLAGSLPPGAPDDCYAAMIELCRVKGAFAALDSSGQALREGLKAKPYLLKPNQQELEQIVGDRLADEAAIVAAARSLVQQGIAWVYVSRGKQGVVVVGQRQAFSATVADPPSPILTHIGCGDAMVAGLAVATMRGESVEQTIRKAVACGVANLYDREPGRFDRHLYRRLLSQVLIKSLNDDA